MRRMQMVAAAWMTAAFAVAFAAEPRPPVTASTIHGDEFRPECAVDGDAETRWASAGFAGRPEWLAVDLGERDPSIPEFGDVHAAASGPHVGGGDADQHLILARHRHRPLFGHQGVGTARHRDADGRHLRWNRETVEDHMRPPGPEILRRTQNRRTELRFLLTD